MNKRIKKKIERRKNKELCERYPFLIPRNQWTGKVMWDYPKGSYFYSAPYSYTELINFPDGWYKAFGKEMIEELRDACIKTDYLNKLRILQIKEKYGGLRFYVGGAPREIHDIIHKYEEISFHYCELCGAPAETSEDGGWLVTWCSKCKKRIAQEY